MVSVSLIFISIVEIFAGLLVIYPIAIFIQIIFYMSIIYILKGVWSMISSIAAGYYFDWMGGLDFIIGITLLLIFSGVTFSFFWIIGLAHILKGIYTLLLSM